MDSRFETLGSRDHGEEVAIFRAQGIERWLARPLTRGELAEGLRAAREVDGMGPTLRSA